MSILNYGIVEVASASPLEIEIGNPSFNVNKIISIVKNIANDNVMGKRQTRIVVFPELSITGYTCGDLFNHSVLIDSAKEALIKLTYETNIEGAPIIFVGAPIRKDNRLFNCAVAINLGSILGFIPKTYIPNYSVFYEARNFSASIERLSDYIEFNGSTIPFTPNLLIHDEMTSAVIAADVCEDLWHPIPPSSYHCLNGANIIVNPSASNEIVGKSKYREDLIKIHSAQNICGYVYTSASKSESTTDNVFSSTKLIAENGYVIEHSSLLEHDKEIVYGEIDVEKCMNERARISTYVSHSIEKYITVKTKSFESTISKFYSKKNLNLLPFVPQNKETMNVRCEEILNIQATGLAQRLSKINCNKAVIGISGGLDSTLALLVTIEAFKINNYAIDGIIAVTMPGFGTTNRTYSNAVKLIEKFGVTLYEIDITKAIEIHFDDIGHDSSVHDTIYENSQARERTQLLMDIANKENGIVIGTGDLSELALGWCTYNGDHMSMYGVNAGVPKTLVKHLVEWMMLHKTNDDTLRIVLADIIDTPISPELLPPGKDGEIVQKTEETIGKYDIHDFILYYFIRYGFSPSKIYNLYINSLELCGNTNYDKKKIKDNFEVFFKRFISQQFKRSALPDGPKVGSISLSPRGDWRMPSDMSNKLWLSDLNKL